MRGPRRLAGAAWEARLLLLHRHQLPQGHGAGTGSAWDRPLPAPARPWGPALLSKGTATWCGSPGHQPRRRPLPPLCEGL